MTISTLDVRLIDDALLPTRANESDAGLDLFASKEYQIPAGQRVLVDTGVQVRIPFGYVGLLFARSSLQKRSLMMANSVGVIDAGYRGNLLVGLINLSHEDKIIDKHEKFAQLVLMPVALPMPFRITSETDEDWQNTTRGCGGFGSTGS